MPKELGLQREKKSKRKLSLLSVLVGSDGLDLWPTSFGLFGFIPSLFSIICTYTNIHACILDTGMEEETRW